MAQETKVADVLPHGKLREVFPNVWVVTGTAAMGGGKMIIPRNMTVIREGTDLTLISAVRLKDEDLTELEKLGTVRHVLKLGFFHGMDDAFYVQKYNAKYWVLEAHRADKLNGVNADVRMNVDTALPFSNAKLHVFKSFTKPEAVILRGDLLIACDAIQNITTTEGCNFMGGMVSRFFGFIRPMNVGPGIVTNNVRPADYTGPTMWDDLQAIDKLGWRNFISAHGEVVSDGSAHETFTNTLNEVWGPKKLNSRYDPMAAAVGSLKSKVLLVFFITVAAGVLYYMRRA